MYTSTSTLCKYTYQLKLICYYRAIINMVCVSFIQCNMISSITPLAELTCHIVAGRTFVYHNSFTSGYTFGARLDVMYEQLLQNQEVTWV